VEIVIVVSVVLTAVAAVTGMVVGAVAMAQRGIDEFVAAQDMALLDSMRGDETETRRS